MAWKKFFKEPLQRSLSKAAFTTLFAFALLGFVDATYLTVEHYLNAVPPCSIGSCETVLTSAYATTVAGIPVALVGALYYFIILILLMIYRDVKNEKLLRWTLFATVIGFLTSLYLVYLQLFVIHAICLYCMGSATTSTALFITAAVILKKYRQENKQNEL